MWYLNYCLLEKLVESAFTIMMDIFKFMKILYITWFI